MSEFSKYFEAEKIKKFGPYGPWSVNGQCVYSGEKLICMAASESLATSIADLPDLVDVLFSARRVEEDLACRGSGVEVKI